MKKVYAPENHFRLTVVLEIDGVAVPPAVKALSQGVSLVIAVLRLRLPGPGVPSMVSSGK
jgi:hypothetical protein